MKLTDFDTIADAKAWEQTRGQQISRNEMNLLLAGAGIYVAFKKIAENDAHPFQNMIAAFLDATQYNFTQSDPIGLQNTAVLDAMIAAELPESPALTALRPRVLGMANVVHKPFSGVTQHEWQLAHETMTRKVVTPVNGWLQVTYTKAVEQHAPNLWIYHEDINFWERVGGIGTVGEAKTYTVKTPRNTPMLIDNAYDAIA